MARRTRTTSPTGPSPTNSVPDKDELLDAYAAVYQVGGETWVYFGADRFDNDGTAQIGFWFFQDDIGISGSSFTGEHVDGDVLIISEYTNGGVVSSICAYQWDGSGGGDNIDQPFGICDTATDGSNLNLVAAGAGCDLADGIFDICAKTNDDVEVAPWVFVNKDDETDFGPGQFFEGGINLSAMFDGQPPCFGSILTETRSSAADRRPAEGLRARRLQHLRPARHRDDVLGRHGRLRRRGHRHREPERLAGRGHRDGHVLHLHACRGHRGRLPRRRWHPGRRPGHAGQRVGNLGGLHGRHHGRRGWHLLLAGRVRAR